MSRSGELDALSVPDWARDLYHAARIRAAKKKLQFSLTANDLLALVQKSNGRCVLSGISFEFDKQGHRVKRPFAPSLDRIDHRLGYVDGNVRLVCVAANVAMNVWGESTLRRLAAGICGYTDVAGVWAPAPRGAGTAVRRLTGGMCSYQARVYLGRGRWRYFGSFKTRGEAAARSAAAKAEIALLLHANYPHDA